MQDERVTQQMASAVVFTSLLTIPQHLGEPDVRVPDGMVPNFRGSLEAHSFVELR